MHFILRQHCTVSKNTCKLVKLDLFKVHKAWLENFQPSVTQLRFPIWVCYSAMEHFYSTLMS